MSPIPGFLLTRHWCDNQGVDLISWAFSTNGPLRLVFPHQQAVCFVERNAHFTTAPNATRKPLDLYTPDGDQVDGLYFQKQRDLQQFREHAGHTRLYESDVKVHDRFLMERFITTSFEALGDPVQHPGYLELVNPRLRPTNFEPSLTYASLDIETDGIDGPILSIALSNQDQEVILMQGSVEDWPTDLPIQWYADERALL